MKTKLVTKLDPSYKVARISVSDEHEQPLYFDDKGRQIPYIEVEEPYRPTYDIEVAKTRFGYSIDLYRDIHKSVISTWAPLKFIAYIIMLPFFYWDKYVWSRLS